MVYYLSIAYQKKQKNKMTYVFFGSTEFSKNVLERLYDSGLIPTCVITSPPKLQGRHQIQTPTPVDLWAKKHMISVLTPDKLDDNFIQSLKNLKPDLAVLVAYGKIIPKQVLNIPLHGILNLHPSLLPKWRGASPIQASILAKDKETGVTVMLLDEQMDHGPILDQIKTDSANQSYPHLSEKLSILGADLLIKTIPLWLAGKITPAIQDEDKSTYCKKIKTIDGLINWSLDNDSIISQILAYNLNPGTYTNIKHQNKDIILKILSAQISKEENPKLNPGDFFKNEKQELLIQCKSGAIVLDIVQPSGKKPMSGSQYLRGHNWLIQNEKNN